MTVIAVLSDLHLTEKSGTIQYQCLEWAASKLKIIKPDIILLLGDMTACGSPSSAETVMRMLGTCGVPIVSTPGNAERRCVGNNASVSIFSSNPDASNGECAVLTVDSSEGVVRNHERTGLEKRIAAVAGKGVLLATHCQPDAMDRDSFNWIKGVLCRNRIKFLLCAHHHRDSIVESRQSVIRLMRGLDPEKAIGGPPAMLIIKYASTEWSFEEIPFPDADISGWSSIEVNEFLDKLGLCLIDKDGILRDMDYAISNKIPCLELRHSATEIDKQDLILTISKWRSGGGRVLSWHLPGMKFDASGSLVEASAWGRTYEALSDLNVQCATLHPPRATVRQIRMGSASRAKITCIAAGLINRLPPGIVLALENLHMSNTEQDNDDRGFGYLPEELVGWLNELNPKLNPKRPVGIMLDCGHVRNNGDFSSFYPLGDWFCDVGKLAVGYHIHQVTAGGKGKINHCRLDGIYGPLISYAGFFQAWHSGMINKCPVFIEVRGQEERYASYESIRKIMIRS